MITPHPQGRLTASSPINDANLDARATLDAMRPIEARWVVASIPIVWLTSNSKCGRRTTGKGGRLFRLLIRATCEQAGVGCDKATIAAVWQTRTPKTHHGVPSPKPTEPGSTPTGAWCHSSAEPLRNSALRPDRR